VKVIWFIFALYFAICYYPQFRTGFLCLIKEKSKKYLIIISIIIVYFLISSYPSARMGIKLIIRDLSSNSELTDN
jgi:hypothetical protein